MTTKVGGVEPVLVLGLSQPYLARVDTGAKTCCIAVNKVFIQNDKLCFYVPDGEEDVLFTTSNWELKEVRNSNGNQMRYFVFMRMQFAGRRFKIQFSLADRSEMKYKILVGRNVLNKNFLVDSSKQGEV